MFDYQKFAQKYKIDEEVLHNIEEETRREFAPDEMMIELHILRALRSYVIQTAKVG
jgi:hypothetical protein